MKENFVNNDNLEFDFEEFFNGKVVAYGAIFNFIGKLTTRFIMHSQQIDNPNFSQDKKVLYKQSITNLESKTVKNMISYAIFDKNDKTTLLYKDDMMLEVGRYKISENIANIKYKLKVEDKNIIVNADDWAYMIDKKHIINKIKIKKFGIPVATIMMNIIKEV